MRQQKQGTQRLLQAFKEPSGPPGLVVTLFRDEDDMCDLWRFFVDMHRGEATFIDVPNTKSNMHIFSRARVRWLPTMVFYHGGKELLRIEGEVGLDKMEQAFIKAKSLVEKRKSC